MGTNLNKQDVLAILALEGFEPIKQLLEFADPKNLPVQITSYIKARSAQAAIPAVPGGQKAVPALALSINDRKEKAKMALAVQKHMVGIWETILSYALPKLKADEGELDPGKPNFFKIIVGSEDTNASEDRDDTEAFLEVPTLKIVNTKEKE